MRPITVSMLGLWLAAGLAACAQDRPPVDETATVEPVGFACLADIDEVADDPLKPTPEPYCRIGLLGSLKLDGRPLHKVAVIDRGAECRRTPKGYAIDLAPGVAARFHAAFRLDPDFVPLADSPACPPTGNAGPVAQLPEGAPLALWFTTAAPVPAPTAAGGTLIVPAAVDARLVEAASGRVLWRDNCRTDAAELVTAAGFPGFGNMREVLSDEALRCARSFATSLGAPPPL